MNKALLSAAAILSLAAGQARALGNPEVGKAAPAFSVKTSDGKAYDLSKLKGKTVVLEWTNPGCPFVKKHYKASSNMQDLQKKYTAKGVVWLSINSGAAGKEGAFEDAAAANAWAKEYKASPTGVVVDGKGELGQLYGAKTTPHMFVIDSKGVLAYKGAIDDKPSASASDIPKSKNWVAAALDELLAGKAVSVGETRPYGCSVKY